MLNKFKQKILNNSDQYNYYKKENVRLSNDLNKKIDKLSKGINRLSKKNKQLNKKINRSQKILESQHVLLELLYCDCELKPKGVLNQIQLLGLELLTFFNNVCKKYNLEYWIDYGTLLGASRHESFVPWDDDLDVGMMRNDYDKLYSFLKAELDNFNLNGDIVLKNGYWSLPELYIPFYQLIYQNNSFNHTMVHIDIFPYDYIKTDTGITQNLFSKLRYDYYFSIYEGTSKEEAFEMSRQVLNLTNGKSNYIIPGVDGVLGGVYPLQIFDTSEIFPLTTIKFMDKEFPCPNEHKEFLKKIYGDYMSIPKTVKHHGLLDFVKQIDNINDIYDEAIEKMREVNENFS